jgi:hypothetical protein
MKIFLSQPMNGRSEEELKKEREEVSSTIRDIYKDIDVEIINTFISESYDEKHFGLKYLAESIRLLDEADEIWMLPGWENARGCKIELACAKSYDIPVKWYSTEKHSSNLDR